MTRRKNPAIAGRTRPSPGVARRMARNKATAGRRALAARRMARSAMRPCPTIPARSAPNWRGSHGPFARKGAARWSSHLQSARTAASARRGSRGALAWLRSTRRRCRLSVRLPRSRPYLQLPGVPAGNSRSRSLSCVEVTGGFRQAGPDLLGGSWREPRTACYLAAGRRTGRKPDRAGDTGFRRNKMRGTRCSSQ